MHPNTPRPAHLQLGARGEELAARYLAGKGLTVVDRNWRCPDGELDLVLSDGNLFVVCEVKTRTSDNWGAPAEAVDDDKAARIRRAARRWRVEWGATGRRFRYDIVAIVWPLTGKPRINHYEGVY